jgi:DNA-binding CsgD family transcriptional regulator
MTTTALRREHRSLSRGDRPLDELAARRHRRRDQLVPVDCPLTREQLRMVRLLSEGLTYGQIAAATGRQPSTVRSHLHAAYRRLDVATSCQAVLACVRAGWLAWDAGDPEQTALLRIEELLQQLLNAHSRRREYEALSTAQRDYLAAFDRYVRAEPRADGSRSRDPVDAALAAVLREAGIARTRNSRGARHDLVADLGALTQDLDGATPVTDQASWS